MNKQILEWFEKNYKHLQEKMKKSEHAYDNENPNPYHLEGNVWVHTMMVYKEANILTTKVEILLAALLHDVGKPDSREVLHDTKRVRFFSHENISTVLSIDILLKYKATVDENIDIIRVLELINWHSDFHQISSEKGLSKKQKIMLRDKYEDVSLFEDMYILSISDALGRETENSTIENTLTRFNFIKEKYKELKTQKEAQKDNKYIKTKKTNTLKILIGIPNSGKSSYIKENGDVNVLSMDNLILEKYPTLQYSEAFKKIMASKESGNDEWRELEKLFNEELQRLIKEQKDITIDKTNLTKKSRRRLLSKVKNNTRKVGVLFLTTISTLSERNIKRADKEGKYISPKVTEMFMKNYSMPDMQEFDEIIYIIEENKYKNKRNDLEEKNSKSFQKKLSVTI